MAFKILKRIAALLLVVVMLAALPISAAGYTYTYNNEEDPVEAPAGAAPVTRLDSFEKVCGKLSGPQDIFITENGEAYICDTGNNRIIITDINGNLIEEIKDFNNNGNPDSFKKPQGIFVTDDGVMYICDTDNARIVALNASKELLLTVDAPSADILTDDFIFTPIKVSLDSIGRIFVISKGFNLGVLEFDHNGEFVQYMGASEVALTLTELFWRNFSTKEQRSKTASSVPTEYNNLAIDDEGFLMVTTSAYEYWQYVSGKVQPLRKLNAKGEDVLVRTGNPSGDLSFTEATANTTYKGPSSLVDVCMLPYDYYSVLDQKRGRVFVYNGDGELCYEFGGPGEHLGGFTTPVALAYSNDCFYIVDSAQSSVTVYRLTEYGKLFSAVAKAQAEIDYKTEQKLWENIIKENANCTLATRGLGMAAYRNQNMPLAMEYFKAADNKEYYSKAFVFVRRAWIENNPIWFSVAAVGLFLLIFGLLKLKSKIYSSAPKGSLVASFGFTSVVAFHPLKGFWDLKKEKHGSVGAAILMLVFTCAVTVISSVSTGFIFNTKDLQKYNLLSDVLIIAAAVLLWCICQWCVAVLMEGEGSFRDIFIATCYSFIHYIRFMLIAVGLSLVLSQNETEFHTVIVIAAYILTALLLVASVKQTHDFSMGKALLVILITLIAMLLVVFIATLVIALLQQMGSFVTDLYSEIFLRI